jgi:hypothetical protein
MPVNRKNTKLPTLPVLLQAVDILNAPDRVEFVEQSRTRKPVRRFDEQEGKVVTLAERAARAYLAPTLPGRARQKRPSTAPSKGKGRKKSSFTFKAPNTSPFFEYEESGKFELDSGAGLVSGDIINDLFVYPELFTSL